MFDLDAFREFREGLAQLRDGDPDAALPLLRQASKRDPENPFYVSYYGLSLAASERRWEEAEKLCHAAVCRARRQAQLYLNLAEVYLAADRRQAAVDTLALGLHYLPKDVRLQIQYGKLCSRRTPVLAFLPRTHAINRSLGRMRQRLVNFVPRRRWLEAGATGAAQASS
jgi:predicted Zn-dependent protease